MAYILIISMHADSAMPPGYDEWGGTHTYMRELINELNDKGIYCILITRRTMEELPAVEQYLPHCKIYRLQNGNLAPMDKTRLREYHVENLLSIQKVIEDYGEVPMVIHSVYWNSGRLGIELAQKYNIPLVHSIISNSYGRQSRGAKEPVQDRAMFEQLIYDYAKWILCVSNDEKEDLIEFYNILPQKIIVAGQYIDTSFILPAHDINGFPRLNSGISFERQKSAALQYNDAFSCQCNDFFWNYKVFTYFGRIDKNKGVDHIINAWLLLYQKYQSKCPSLWLIGGSLKEIYFMRKKENHFTLLEQAEKENKLIWWGCIDSIGASTILMKTMVLVTNSLYEPGGRVITEAMIEGIPVIATSNGFAKDLIKNWENGFLVSHGDEAELAMRMEHFIRQPFLANVLGENARQTALEVIKSWKFLSMHLFAYGLSELPKIAPKDPFIDYFKRREITIFPYRNLQLSKNLLCKFLKDCTGECSISEPKRLDISATSDIYLIRGNNNSYIIKHPYTRMALSPIITPLRKNEYVRNNVDFYRYEVLAYETSKSNLLIGKDDFHQLLLLCQLDPYNPSTDEYSKVIDFLCSQCIPLNSESTGKYNEIIYDSNFDTLEDFEQFFIQLRESFPDYYFEPSLEFSPYLGWKFAQYLLSYNRSAFSYTQFKYMNNIHLFFSEKCEKPVVQCWYEIIADINIKHIMLDNNDKFNLIDREKRTIGIKEYVIADFLLAFLLSQDLDSFNEYICLLRSIYPNKCNYKQIIESLAYKYFYETVIISVLHTESIDSNLSILKKLQYLENEYENTINRSPSR